MISAWSIASDLAPFSVDQEQAALARFVKSQTKNFHKANRVLVAAFPSAVAASAE